MLGVGMLCVGMLFHIFTKITWSFISRLGKRLRVAAVLEGALLEHT